MIAILSIKTKYVEKILKVEKKYEFRKNSFRKDLDEVFVYATKPIGEIVCKFYVGDIIVDKPKELWKNFKEFSGLTDDEFFTYFQGREKGVAIEIREVEKFTNPIDPKDLFPKFIPPQSWIYVSPDEFPHNSSYSGSKND